MARALLFQANLHIRFWGENVLTATYLINRTPSVLLTNKTPYEVLHGVALSFENLRTFGLLCYARRINLEGAQGQVSGAQHSLFISRLSHGTKGMVNVQS